MCRAGMRAIMHPEKACISLCKVSVKILQIKETVNIQEISANV
jgi:hypothetical protein